MSEITDADALRIAQEACARQGIPWREPHSVKKGWRWWTVVTPSNQRGGTTMVSISRATSKVKVRHHAR